MIYISTAFIPSTLERELHYSINMAMFITMIASICYFSTAPFWGLVSDKIGRKKVLLVSCIAIDTLIYPSLYNR